MVVQAKKIGQDALVTVNHVLCLLYRLSASIFIFTISIKYRLMIRLQHNSLSNIIRDPNFAWELLQCEVAIQMNENIDGLAIAKLLELYMMGVQKLNSAMDVRQNYFLNKKTSLMSKANVIKSLSRPPMAKKQKPLEATAKLQDPKAEIQSKEVKKKKRKTSKQGELKGNSIKVKQQQEIVMSSFALQQKKREIEMRLAYQSAGNSQDKLSKILTDFENKEMNFMNKVKNVIENHEERLQQRLNRRKLRTATYRSRPEETNDTFIEQDIDHLQAKKQHYQPFQIQSKNIVFQPNNDKYKKCKSLDNKIKHELTSQFSPRKVRRLTIDLTGAIRQLAQLKPLVWVKQQQIQA